MEITSTQENECCVLALSGRLDATTAVTFDESASKALSDGKSMLLVDMKDLVYVSSAGLRSFLSLAKKLKANKGKLCFCSPQPMVNEVFRISGFDRMLQVFETRDAGLAALRA